MNWYPLHPGNLYVYDSTTLTKWQCVSGGFYEACKPVASNFIQDFVNGWISGLDAVPYRQNYGMAVKHGASLPAQPRARRGGQGAVLPRPEAGARMAGKQGTLCGLLCPGQTGRILQE
jgi:hypothetical protein